MRNTVPVLAATAAIAALGLTLAGGLGGPTTGSAPRRSPARGVSTDRVAREPGAGTVGGTAADAVGFGPRLEEVRASGSVTVRVIGMPEETPLSDVEVRLRDHFDEVFRRETGADGTVTFTGVRPQEASVSVRPRGRDGDWREVELSGQDARVEFRLARSGRISGRVVDGRDGSPFPGAEVRLLAEHLREREDDFLESLARGDAPAATTTGPEGEFAFDDVPHGVERCAVALVPGFRAAVREFTLPTGREERTGLVLRLLPSREIRGTVRDPEGRPVAGASVHADPVGDLEPYGESDDDSDSYIEGLRQVRCDGDGAYRIGDLLLEGRYRLVATAPGSSDSEPLDLAPGEVTSVSADFSLRPAARLVLLLRLPDGSPARGACAGVGTWPSEMRMTEESPGRLVLDVGEAGRHWLHVSLPGYPTEERTVDIEPGRETTVEIRCATPAWIEGTLRDPRGNPLSGEVLGERRRGGPGEHEACFERAAADGAGHFLLGPLKAGDYDLELWPGRYLRGGEAVPAPTHGLELVLEERHPRPAEVRLDLVLPPSEAPERFWAYHLQECEDGSRRWVEACGARGIYWEQRERAYAYDAGVDRRLGLDVPGFLPVEIELSPAPGGVLDRGQVHLERGLPLAGRVLDDRGLPVPGARVRVVEEGGRFTSWRWRATASGDGGFLVESLPEGELNLALDARGHFPVTVRCAVTRGGEPVTLTLPRGGLLRATVRDEAGRPRPGARILLRPAGGLPSPEDWVAEYRANLRGALEVRLFEGEYRLEAPGDDGASRASAEFRIASGRDVHVALGGAAR